MKINDIDESPIGDLKRFVHRQAFPGHYDRAANYLYKVLKRKQEENGGNWRHAFGYYAQQIGKSFKDIDTRNLMKIFKQRYGEEFPKLVKEFKVVKPDPKDTKGIKRKDMPQVATKDYPALVDYLKDNGVTLKAYKIDPNKLKSTQGEFSDAGVEKQLQKQIAGTDKKPVIISKDMYVIDGHHRWIVAKNIGDDLDVIMASIDADALLNLLHKFEKTTYKDIYTERLVKLDKKGPKNLKGLKKKSKYEKRKQMMKQVDDLDEAWNLLPLAGAVATQLAKKGVRIAKDLIVNYVKHQPPGASPDAIANTLLKTDDYITQQN